MNKIVMLVARDGDKWRAEVWVKPFNGWMVACTRAVTSKAQARRDGHQYLQYDTEIPNA